MSVKIRLRRMGAKKRPFFRLVVADSRAARDGRFIETLGYYNPCITPKEIKIDAERANYWLSCGAQPSDTARALLKKQGIGKQPESAKQDESAAASEESVAESAN